MTPLLAGAIDMSLAIPGNGSLSATAAEARPTPTRSRLQPLSAASYRVEFTASTERHDKIEQARNLLSHAIPNGDLALLFERALDALLQVEVTRRLGAGRQRQHRVTRPGSRHVPREVARAVWERDGFQCTFTDAQGRRCTERRFITLEHREPFARGGPASADNLCLLCSPHNAERAREEFGEAHVEAKRLEAAAHEKTLRALLGLGFERRGARAALEALRQRGTKPEVEPLLKAALVLLVK
jgi:RuvA, C-terminal domain